MYNLTYFPHAYFTYLDRLFYLAIPDKIKELIENIEVLRKKLVEIASDKGIADEKVLQASRRLDEELNKYYHLLKEREK